MATVTIAKSYFDALLRRAEFHTSDKKFETTPSLSNVTVSKTEHEYLLQAVREYHLLKNALFRGGLTAEALETLLSGESDVVDQETATNDTNTGEKFIRPHSFPIMMTAPRPDESSQKSDNTAVGDGSQTKAQPHSYNRVDSYGQPDLSIDTSPKDDESHDTSQHVPVHDQRTIIVTNLSDRTTHKDLVGVIRGGRLLDIFLRRDRSATISFVEGAADFLAYAKRNDIYLHTKRLQFRWYDRQFHVPPHVFNKIANGATRNLVIRGAAGKFTADQIRDHLDHIHNLIVVDINFKNGDAYISINSIHNALFARTCMMSRTVYKGFRIDWYPDECATSLPRPSLRVDTPTPAVSMNPMSITNRYTLLDPESDLDSDSDAGDGSYIAKGIRVHANNWADAVA